jgi:hypothetical protein
MSILGNEPPNTYALFLRERTTAGIERDLRLYLARRLCASKLRVRDSFLGKSVSSWLLISLRVFLRTNSRICEAFLFTLSRIRFTPLDLLLDVGDWGGSAESGSGCKMCSCSSVSLLSRVDKRSSNCLARSLRSSAAASWRMLRSSRSFFSGLRTKNRARAFLTRPMMAY